MANASKLKQLTKCIAAIITATGVVACGPSVPDKWKEFVPKQERDAMTQAMDLDGKFSAPALMMFYDEGETSVVKLFKAYNSKIETAGYKSLLNCPVGESANGNYGKITRDKKEVVGFHAYVLSEDTIRADVTHSDKTTSLHMADGQQESCKWTDFAQEFCSTVADDYCLLE